MASQGENFYLGPEMRLDHTEFLCSKVFLRCKGIEKADMDIIRRQEECPLAGFLARRFILVSKLLIIDKINTSRLRVAPNFSPNTCILR